MKSVLTFEEAATPPVADLERAEREVHEGFQRLEVDKARLAKEVAEHARELMVERAASGRPTNIVQAVGELLPGRNSYS